MGPAGAQTVLSLIAAVLYSFYGNHNLNAANSGTDHLKVQIAGRAFSMDTFAIPRASKLNWDEAQKYCKDKHGDTGRLTNMDDEETFLILQDALGKQYPGVHLKVWVDGAYDKKRHEFIWRQRGIPVDQPWTPWGKGEPTKPFTDRRRVVYHQITDTRAEFHTDDKSGLHGYLCQYSPT